jgi:hypothetical protein
MAGDDKDSEAQSRGPAIDPEAGGWTSLEAWKTLPPDPDVNRELGYDLTDWDVVTPADESDQLIFLPTEEETIREDAFVIASADSVCDLDEQK